MIKIYHNPRCRKSREGLQILEDSGQEYKVIEYLKNPLNVEELTEIIKKLRIAPIELVRKNETIWKENFKGQKLSDIEIIQSMIKYPKLIERPIVEIDKIAIIGRPPNNILKLL